MKRGSVPVVRIACVMCLMALVGGTVFAAKNSPGKEEARAKRSAAPGETSAVPANWVITGYQSGAPGNVFYNTDTVKLSLTLSSLDPHKPLTIKGGTWRIKEIQDAEKWPHQSEAERRFIETNVVSGEGTVAAQSGQNIVIPIEWKPTKLGAFGVYLHLNDGSGATEQMVEGLVVVYPPAPGVKPDSPIVFNLGNSNLPTMAEAHKRLGIKWVRGETGWGANEPSPGEWDWSKTDPGMQAAKANDILVMNIMAHAPAWAAPRIEPKIGIWYWRTFPETSVMPNHLADWQEWARRYVERYKGTVRVGVMLNEPWEGGSLSGWNSNGAHYREMLRAFSAGVHAADPTFKVLGNDSGMNVEDNLLVEPGVIDLLDAVSFHTYRSYNGFYAAQYAAYGKKVWDTESWIGTGASSMVQQVAFELAQGFVKMQPINTSPFGWIEAKPGELRQAAKKAAAATETQAAPVPAYASPTSQAMSTLLHFIEDADFYREARSESLPWMFVFKGRAGGPTPDKNVAVILGRDNRWDNFPWYRITADGQLTLSDPDHVLTAYDVQGNPLPRSGAALQIPLTTTVYYLVSSKGADDLVQRLRDASIHGLQPVQLALCDFTRPLSQNPPLRVKVTNAYNVPVSGSVEVKAPEGWAIKASQPFSNLKPGETTELSFPVTKAVAVPANRYPFAVTAKTDKGNAELKERLSAAVLVKGTPPLKGTAADWEKLGAVPVYMAGGTTAADSFLTYAMPFLNLKEQDDSAYLTEFMGMWDENNFYILADINDPTERLHPSMAKGTWFNMYPPPNQFVFWGPHSTPGSGGDMLNLAFNVLPYGEKQIANFPPAAQKKVDPKWRINPADYEYSLYLAKQNRVVPGDFEKALAELKHSDHTNGALRQPKYEDVGPPIPEVWRLMAPGLERKNYGSSSPRVAKDQGLVPSATLNVTREGNVWHYRAAIPWSELALVKPLAMDGRTVGFSFECKNDNRTAVSWSAARSVARFGQEVLHPTFEAAWSPDTQWGFVDLKK